jgi:hypothetical protein
MGQVVRRMADALRQFAGRMPAAGAPAPDAVVPTAPGQPG